MLIDAEKHWKKQFFLKQRGTPKKNEIVFTLHSTVERKESVFGGKDDTQIQPLANGLTIHYDIEKPCDGLHEPVRPDAFNDNGSALGCTEETTGKKLADVNMNGSQASEPTSLGLDLTN